MKKQIALEDIKMLVDQTMEDVQRGTLYGLLFTPGEDGRMGTFNDSAPVADKAREVRRKLYGLILEALASRGTVVTELADLSEHNRRVYEAMFREIKD